MRLLLGALSSGSIEQQVAAINRLAFWLRQVDNVAVTAMGDGIAAAGAAPPLLALLRGDDKVFQVCAAAASSAVMKGSLLCYWCFAVLAKFVSCRHKSTAWWHI